MDKKLVRPCPQKTSPTWLFTSVISATQEVEVKRSLKADPKQKHKTLSEKQTKAKERKRRQEGRKEAGGVA
jgi:hypothetical protein